MHAPNLQMSQIHAQVSHCSLLFSRVASSSHVHEWHFHVRRSCAICALHGALPFAPSGSILAACGGSSRALHVLLFLSLSTPLLPHCCARQWVVWDLQRSDLHRAGTRPRHQPTVQPIDWAVGWTWGLVLAWQRAHQGWTNGAAGLAPDPPAGRAEACCWLADLSAEEVEAATGWPQLHNRQLSIMLLQVLLSNDSITTL